MDLAIISPMVSTVDSDHGGLRSIPKLGKLLKQENSLAMLEAIRMGSVPALFTIPLKSVPSVEGPSGEGEGRRSAVHKVKQNRVSVWNKTRAGFGSLSTTYFRQDPPRFAEHGRGPFLILNCRLLVVRYGLFPIALGWLLSVLSSGVARILWVLATPDSSFGSTMAGGSETSAMFWVVTGSKDEGALDDGA